MNKSTVPTSVTFQGEPGSFSHTAAKFLFPQAQLVGVDQFDQVFEKVATGKTSQGIVPIENTLAGSVAEVYDLLLNHQLHIVNELSLKIALHLMAPKLSTEAKKDQLKQITHAHSHPKALEQCVSFFKANPKITPVAELDTAGSARLIRLKNNPNHAAIASLSAAKLWKLQLLQKNIHTNSQNFTRFMVLSRQAGSAKTTKTSLVFGVANIPGSLVKALNPFAAKRVNLIKIESRPLLGKPWEYLFFVDLAVGVDHPSFQTALKAMQRVTRFVRILGSYPKGKTITEANL